MSKKEVMELKRRIKKDSVTFNHMSCCYVNSSKEKLFKTTQNFLNLEDEEFFKYMEIAKKVLSGKFGDGILSLPFTSEERQSGGKQQFLLGLRESFLKNEALLDRFYDLIIQNYEYVGNYLIVLFHDDYDVITRTKDNAKLEDSEEVFEYLLCAICPVTLSKPGLSFNEYEKIIAPRTRDWVVGVPESGFVFPAFTERTTDIDNLWFYSKNVKEPHDELMEGLGCNSKRTATEQRNIFDKIVKEKLESADEDVDDKYLDIQENLNARLEELKGKDETALTSDDVKTILEDSGIETSVADSIEKTYAKTFEKEIPTMSHVIDEKLLKNEDLKEKKTLKEQVKNLSNQISGATKDIVVNVPPEKQTSVKTQLIDGKMCIIIPLEDGEKSVVNGRNL